MFCVGQAVQQVGVHGHGVHAHVTRSVQAAALGAAIHLIVFMHAPATDVPAHELTHTCMSLQQVQDQSLAAVLRSTHVPIPVTVSHS